MGAEKVLGNEIKHLGYKLIDNAAGRVRFLADDDSLFRANLCLRCADRVFLQMADYEARDFDSLFDGAYSLPWQDFFYKDVHLVVDKVRANKSKLSSEHSVQSMIQKAIYKKLGDIWHFQTMPETGAESSVRVYINSDRVLLLLDLSGLPLHKRGYRTDGGTAPLRETVASSMIQLMTWRRAEALHDPFCGSGTIAIEAMLYAHNVAPGFGRRFALENLKIFDKERADEIRKSEAEKIRTDVEVRVTGSDIDRAAVNRAKKNAEYACVMAGRALQSIGKREHIVRPDFIESDFADLSAPFESGLLLCNPPYGERLGDEESAKELYGEMQCLLDDFANWKLGVITSSPHFEQCFGQNATKQKKLKAGNLDTVFYMFDKLEKSRTGKENGKRGRNFRKY